MSFHLIAEDWKELDDDLWFKSIEYNSGFFSSNLILIKTKLQKFDLSVASAKDLGKERLYVDEAVIKSNAIFGINANYFDEFGKPLGLVVTKGIQRAKVHRGGDTLTGIFYLNKSNYKIINRDEWNANFAVEAVQGGPRLISNNQIVDKIKNQNSTSRRSGICINKNDELILFVTSGITGISINQLQNILLENGCQEALNMDGGGSAQAYMSSRNKLNQELLVNGRDPVPVFLLLSKITN